MKTDNYNGYKNQLSINNKGLESIRKQRRNLQRRCYGDGKISFHLWDLFDNEEKMNLILEHRALLYNSGNAKRITMEEFLTDKLNNTTEFDSHKLEYRDLEINRMLS